MSNSLIRKLDHSGYLNDADRATLRAVTMRSRKVGPRQDLIVEGERPDDVLLIMDGLACRYKLMSDGKRQIMALFVPGDYCDLHVAILDRMDHSICTISACTVVNIPRTTIQYLSANHPRITLAFWWATLVDEAILREWLVNLGRREADRRLAHLVCELLLRLQAVDQAGTAGFDLRMTQSDMSDVLGISAVHTNRILQDLRSRGLLLFKGRRVIIPDIDALKGFCEFDPTYLHLSPRQDVPEAMTAQG